MQRCLGQSRALSGPLVSSGRPTHGSASHPAHIKHGQRDSRRLGTRVKAVTVTDTKTAETAVSGAPAQAQEQPAAATGAAAPSSDDASLMAAKINAVASKINAARELARRLSEEKQAAGSKNGGSGEAMRNAEEASAAAAAQAARADALARALRKAENTRDSLQRLKAENEALRELLLELAADKDQAKTRLGQVADAAYAAVLRTAPPPAPRGTLPAPADTTTSAAAAVAPAPVAAPAPEATKAQQALFTEPAVQKDKPSVEPAAPPQAQAAPAVSTKPPAAPARPAPAPSAAAPAPPAPVVDTPVAPPVAPPPPVTTPSPQAAVSTPPAPPAAPPVEVFTPEVVQEPAAPPASAVSQEPPTVPAPTTIQPAARGPRPSNVQDRIKASIPQLQQLAAMAAKAGQNLFTLPPQPVPIDGPVRIFYNRAKGPLPSSSAVVLKMGLNKWDTVNDIEMTQVDGLPRNSEQHWWEATVDLPAEIYRVDFVLYDKHSQNYDNNQSKDYRLDLSGAPTEHQLLELRLEAYRAFETQRMAYLESENARLWRSVEMAALEAAGQERIKYRQSREQTLRQEAQALVNQRRKAEASGVPVRDAERGVYAWTTLPVAGKKAFLAYNKGRGPLANTGSVRLHMGYDGWWNQIKQTYDMKPMSSPEVDQARLKAGVEGNHSWYGCWVDVPHSSGVLDFVLSDNNQAAWDNNNYQDYHTRVNGAHNADNLSDLLYQALKKESEPKDQEAEDAIARSAYNRVTMRGEALRKRRTAVNDFLYTVPYTPVPGQKVDVYYNPEHSPLRGRPNIYMRAGFNRWSWGQNQARGVQSIKLEPTLTNGIGFYHGALEVPKDAWGLDMVFIDTDDVHQATGFYDNNGGLDYHVPVKPANDGAAVHKPGSTAVYAPIKVVHIAVEMAPIAKVGGMGDVVTALGRAVQEEGHQVECLIPKYDCINYGMVENLRQDGSFNHEGTTVRVWKGLVEGLPTTFLEPENGHFWRGCIYGRNDDAVRFGFHCSSALAYLAAYNVKPNILHCHDWQSAPIAWGNRGSARCVFTIHNLSYGADLVGRAMASCEIATTVSPTYAGEISGNGAIAPHLGKLYGIRNGIDADTWNPGENKYLPRPYTADNAIEGKEAARRELRSRLGLGQIDVPIVSVVTRLVAQKGIHLIKHAAWRTLERGGQYVLLGSAPDGKVQAEFNALRDQLKAQYHDRAALVFTYDEPLSHLIYAGSDIFLVPSMFEPCGLTQMIAMQYGTVPVVRKTGGLADTVFDLDHDEDRAAAAGMEPNGFVFEGTDAPGMDYALNRAMAMWYSDRGGWQRLVQRIMRQDWSWYSPSLDYIELYYKAMRS